MRLRPTSAILVLCAIVPAASSAIADAPETPRARQNIRFDDLSKRYQIVGRLGMPLGQVVHVKGTWKSHPEASEKFGKRFLHISEINKTVLRKPVVFNARYVRTHSTVAAHVNEPDPSEVSFNVYEGVAYSGPPPEQFKEPGYVPGAGEGRWELVSILTTVQGHDPDLKMRAVVRGNVTELSYDDLAERSQIVGRLGVPAGKHVWVKATWRAKEETEESDDELCLHISEVDGQVLPQEVVFLERNVGTNGFASPPKNRIEAVEGRTYELRVYERIAMCGNPPGVWLRTMSFVDRETRPWGLTSRLLYNPCNVNHGEGCNWGGQSEGSVVSSAAVILRRGRRCRDADQPDQLRRCHRRERKSPGRWPARPTVTSRYR